MAAIKLFFLRHIVLCLLFFKGSTPLHNAAGQGHTEVVELLIGAGASLSVENKEVIKTSVNPRQSNIKPFK
jgi:ankyrin repeat protein